jgi:hypothetical protein
MSGPSASLPGCAPPIVDVDHPPNDEESSTMRFVQSPLRNLRLAFLAAPLLATGATAQSLTVVDEKFFGGAGNQFGTGIAAVDTGSGFSVYASGYSEALNGEGLLVKYQFPVGSTTSSQSWSAGFPGVAGDDYFGGVAATATNAYAAGHSFSHTVDTVGDKEQKGIIVNYAAAGGVVWERQTPAAPGAYAYGGFEGARGIATAVQSGQQTLYAVGAGQSGGFNGGRFFISKLDAAGNIAWTRTNDNSGAAPASGGNAVAANGTHAILAGFTDDPGPRTTLLRSYDAGGGVAWSATSVAGTFNGVTLDNSANSLYAVGRTNPAASDFLIEKRTLTGGLVWSRTFDRFGAEDILTGVAVVDGRLFAVGSTRGGTAGLSDGVVLEFDPLDGDLLFTTLWGGAFDDAFTGVVAGDHALHLVGSTRSFGGGGSDLAFVTMITGVPEPSTFATVGVGLLGALWYRRRAARTA